MKSVIVGTAGHIDHGKSALVRALTGIDPDRLKEEKARGITIDLGFAHCAVGDVQIAFVDVPGHERFVKNMLAGIGGIDLVVLVVASDESVMPQTREHFDICRLLRVPAGIVALTKADLVDAETLELVRLEVRDLVAASFLERAPIVPLSARTGQGLDDFRAALAGAAHMVRGRPAEGAARLPVDRVFSIKGFGTVVTGTLVSGRISVDDDLAVRPGDRRVKVRNVQVHGVDRGVALAGQRTALNLSGIEVHELARGQQLLAPGAFEVTRVADASIEVLPAAKPLKHGARVRVHQGTAEILGRVVIVGPPDDHTDRSPTSGRERPTIRPGSPAFVRLRLERPAVLVRGDRYIIRAYSPAVTVAGGHILDPHPPKMAIRTQAALERSMRLDFEPRAETDRETAELSAANVFIGEAGVAGLPIAALTSRIGIAPGVVAARVDALVARREAVRAGDALVAPAMLDRLKRDLVAMLERHHRDQPLSDGVPREEARERIAGGHRAVFERALDELQQAGKVAARDRLALATHRIALSADEAKASAIIERRLRDAGLKPPDVGTLAADTGVSPAVTDRIVKLLQRQKILVLVDTLLFHDEALAKLKKDVQALKVAAESNGRIDVATFKERFGVSRKFAIPLLEYLDRERVTRRVGDARVIL